MGKTFIGVRDVDEETFRKLRIIAIAKRRNLGELLTRAINKYVEEEKLKEDEKHNPRNLLKIKPIKVGKKVKWSKEIDEILYGGKDDSSR